MMRNSIVTLGLAVVATLIAGLVAKYLARRSLRPLYALDRGIEAVRRSRDFGDWVKVSSNDEFGSLTRTSTPC
jgi:nitrate/nitrite-specific signal transduction histidine kinase